ncbi:LLM class flavin-dependent oxidoreductase [Sanguibacter antarcticus]|uniref:Luciferase-like monooxygenase n=1 Tax=Sanguibacter antarcticus TaxID=372484 RepID=A0A2A9E1N2_9MICO|nr:LLM class flavin-dependent oxidoreductase [Sanguibacter antarcticus]PFG32556.1 luciferase-like monooxygenase [Sanguibacter antarcticus]
MRIGIVILPQHRWSQAAGLWRRAEEYGFDHAWTYDHLAWRSLADEPWFATVPTLAGAALVTSTIRLGTWVASPNFRHPVPFAKELMTLDDMSEGRMLLGVGAGGLGVDAAVLGQPPLTPGARVDRLDEFVSMLDELLTQPVTSRTGTYFGADGARTIPGCVQQPRMPFLVAANAPRSMSVAVRRGDAWVTTGAEGQDTLDDWWGSVARLSARFTDALAEAGRPASTPRYLNLDSQSYSLTSAERFWDQVGRAEDLGFTDVVVHWPRAEGIYAGDETVLEAVADRLRPS